MFRRYVERGLLAGGVGGFAFGLFVAFVGNPMVGYAESLAGGHHTADAGTHAGEHGGHAVSSLVTAAVSVGGGVLWGLLLGGIVFGVVYYFLEPAIPGPGATKSYLLAGAGFVTASGAPWLVLPPQPAGVEQALPTETRLVWYVGMAAAGATVCVLAGATYRRLAARTRPWLAAAGALAPFALLAIPVVLAPANPVTGDVPAGMAATFRGFVVFGQLGLWFVLAAAHAQLGSDAGETTTEDVSVQPAD